MNARYISLTMQIDKREDAAETVRRTIDATLLVQKSTSFKDFNAFLNTCNKIFREAQKLAKAQEAGNRSNESYSISLEAGLEQYGEDVYYTWAAEPTSGDVCTVKGEESIYFRPVTAPDHYDLMITADILGSLAEAGL